jgi:hypothetical protein
MFLTSKITDNFGQLKKDIDIAEEIMSDDAEAIIEKHYYEQVDRPYVGGYGDEFKDPGRKN